MKQFKISISIIITILVFIQCNSSTNKNDKKEIQEKSENGHVVDMPFFKKGELLASEDFSDNLDKWMTEGDVTARIDSGLLYFSSDSSQSDRRYQKGNIWWRFYVQSPYILEYEYKSLNNNRGLSMVFWNSFGLDGKNVFQWERTGLYDEYINGNLHAYHVSYHRFNSNLSNIRKAPGFHLVSSQEDPIPQSDTNWHKIKIATAGNHQKVYCDGKLVHDFIDESKTCMNEGEWMHTIPCSGTGDVPLYGAIGIRHTQKQQALYDNFKIYRLDVDISTKQMKNAIIIDNNDAGFSKKGEWKASTRDKAYEGENYLWCKNGDGSAKAVFSPKLPNDGKYRVYIKWVASKPSDRATNAKYTVKFGDVIQSMKVDLTQLEQAGKWFMLGEYSYSIGDDVSVTLTNKADNTVVADAAMFILNKNK